MVDPARVDRPELGLPYSTGFARGYCWSAPSGPEPFFPSVTARYISCHTDWLPGQCGNEIVNSNHFFESECVSNTSPDVSIQSLGAGLSLWGRLSSQPVLKCRSWQAGIPRGRGTAPHFTIRWPQVFTPRVTKCLRADGYRRVSLVLGI
jgi:hypothetical protein